MKRLWYEHEIRNDTALKRGKMFELKPGGWQVWVLVWEPKQPCPWLDLHRPVAIHHRILANHAQLRVPICWPPQAIPHFPRGPHYPLCEFPHYSLVLFFYWLFLFLKFSSYYSLAQFFSFLSLFFFGSNYQFNEFIALKSLFLGKNRESGISFFFLVGQLYQVFHSTHYSGADLIMKFGPNEPWKKVYGPIFIYFNSLSDGLSPINLWEDAKQQVTPVTFFCF